MFHSILLLPSWLFILSLLASNVHGARLVDFQVAQPPPLPQDATRCTVLILKRTFAFSFGAPEVVQLTPPTDCGVPGSWAGISLNFTVTSNGTQFDRLGIVTFQNVEIWRTSTPEPVRGDGIIWTYLKDVTRFIPLFSKPGTFILQLDNLIEPGLDGEYATTLEATYFASSQEHPPAPRSDLIVPLTTLRTIRGTMLPSPPGFRSVLYPLLLQQQNRRSHRLQLNVTLPRNAVAAYAELQASGNGNEEFWYFNVPNQFLGDLPAGTTFGNGPFREVRVLVDGQVAGVAFPYAVIFTGGIVPTAWRPITSYGAIDLPTYHLDLTPFIPILTDGKPHNISLDVASAEPDHRIDQNWFVSGLLQVRLDSSSRPTTGRITRYEASNFATSSASGSVNGEDVHITVSASHSVHIEAEIIGGSGARTEVVFTQALQYENVQDYLQNTTVQNVFQTASGQVLSRHNGEIALQDTFVYPLVINFAITSPDGSNFSVAVDHSYDRILRPAPFILGSTIAERQLSGGSFHLAPTGNTGSNGTSNNTFDYVDTTGHTYTRQVNASSNVITLDRQGGNLAPSPIPDQLSEVSPAQAVMKARLPGGRVIGGN
ncbi:peptide N-acetyl-beta-D-glucosaminyl asparaginase amidase A-domain-containing protein [Multifurca ochricompacta]|uniref:Peptide N-acetyl-beta-D-glucosaminyl asparaginase amidase A-domain-containing protein n=1 Tax=Multifurca ochricompacta TaxID=376703 RepID=A0AAD4MA29_9AGAM|nr:peptide N-acetyl-beta-D-glucosaminyl asparaginase amidase A-domain-containing protein [Multifurca ochricompacta]